MSHRRCDVVAVTRFHASRTQQTCNVVTGTAEPRRMKTAENLQLSEASVAFLLISSRAVRVAMARYLEACSLAARKYLRTPSRQACPFDAVYFLTSFRLHLERRRIISARFCLGIASILSFRIKPGCVRIAEEFAVTCSGYVDRTQLLKLNQRLL
jgi:hypothetical protein